jgi:APA family basic amino acid/polyamine antiporter
VAVLPERTPVTTSHGGWGAFALVVTWVSFSYSGWNAAVYVAGEVDEPERNVPRALLLGTGVVTGLYLALNALFLASAPVSVLAGRPDIASVAALTLGGPTLQRALTALIALTMLTSVSASIIAGPRVIMQMAREGALPVPQGTLDRPLPATLLLVGLALGVVWVAGLAAVLGYVGFTLTLSATAAVAGLLAMRWREGARAVPIPGYPWVPGLFLLANVSLSVLVALREPGVAAAGVATVLLLPLLSGGLADKRARRSGHVDPLGSDGVC